jgi:hypothetical protein
MDGISLVLAALAVTLAIPIACIVFPSLLPHAHFNEQGHRYFVDIAAFKGGCLLGAVLCVGSAFKQGDTQPGVLLMAAGLGVAVGAVIGLWAHLVWRRQQRWLRSRPDSLLSR